MEKKIEDLKYNCMWNNDNIQYSLEYLRDNPSEKKKLTDVIKARGGYDARALLSCIDECWYEEFDRYDSDVAEQYIRLFRDNILDNEYIDCPDGVKRKFTDYYWYVKQLSRADVPLTEEEEEIVEKSGWADFWRNLY